ncbi:hypothetical protein LguiA_029238 [Lonicera macranthoides]
MATVEIETTKAKQGEGLRQYYLQHIHDLQLQVRRKTHNLNRLEAKRNDLNSRGLAALSFGVWMSHPTGCVFDLSSVTSAFLKPEKGGAVTVAISFQGFFENPTKSTVQVGEVRFELICYHAKLASIKADSLFLVPATDKKILVPRTLRE